MYGAWRHARHATWYHVVCVSTAVNRRARVPHVYNEKVTQNAACVLLCLIKQHRKVAPRVDLAAACTRDVVMHMAVLCLDMSCMCSFVRARAVCMKRPRCRPGGNVWSQAQHHEHTHIHTLCHDHTTPGSVPPQVPCGRQHVGAPPAVDALMVWMVSKVGAHASHCKRGRLH